MPGPPFGAAHPEIRHKTRVHGFITIIIIISMFKKYQPYQEHSVQCARFPSPMLMLPRQAGGFWDPAPRHAQWPLAVFDRQTAVPPARPPECRTPVDTVSARPYVSTELIYSYLCACAVCTSSIFVLDMIMLIYVIVSIDASVFQQTMESNCARTIDVTH